jgi:hypothetical protein
MSHTAFETARRFRTSVRAAAAAAAGVLGLLVCAFVGVFLTAVGGGGGGDGGERFWGRLRAAPPNDRMRARGIMPGARGVQAHRHLPVGDAARAARPAPSGVPARQPPPPSLMTRARNTCCLMRRQYIHTHTHIPTYVLSTYMHACIHACTHTSSHDRVYRSWGTWTMSTAHKAGGECLRMWGRGFPYHLGRGSLLFPSSSLCWPTAGEGAEME